MSSWPPTAAFSFVTDFLDSKAPPRPPSLTTSSQIWVVPYRKTWALQLEHEKKPFVVVSQDKAKAIDMGRTLAQTQATHLVIFDDEQNEESREDHTTTTLKRPKRTSGIRRPK